MKIFYDATCLLFLFEKSVLSESFGNESMKKSFIKLKKYLFKTSIDVQKESETPEKEEKTKEE